ncbi:hypothetical protein CAPTEDRAFT_227494 [Capitella teleta]|uniref:Inhibitor of growth protein N-terminal histone-binding domain-containing protein n=1 Tax=Capitella teleta TaxID=283909 RepID=R7UIV9_CAPTE|nr:hypothetical protein CAPTEDRAFT_227494 [Capitella teleta]|eukprot:ELU06105.1 hypothetical protein CAPTEDRAFT_227494 [Capitella teleta]
MATAMYLEHYLDSLETLPMELQRNFNLMRDLDSRSQEVLKEIDSMADQYMSSVKDLAPTKRTESLKTIQKKFNKSREYGDDKVQLALQTYEMVDKHIRKLDADLARFEAELKEKSLGANVPSLNNNQPGKISRGEKSEKKRKRGEKGKDLDDEQPRKKKNKKGAAAAASPEREIPTAPPVLAVPINISLSHPSDVLDMPVDPNEPTYCLCHQVSYGEMIGCDNPDCGYLGLNTILLKICMEFMSA